VRFAEKPSDEEQEQEMGISVMFVDFLSKRQKIYSTHACEQYLPQTQPRCQTPLGGAQLMRALQ
jgi:hypothetical protein